MNELEVVRTVRRALDERAERLPYRVTHRLERARGVALARIPATAAAPVPQARLAALGPSPEGLPGARQPSLLWRATVMVVPIALLVAGLMAVSMWSEIQRAEEVAELDTAVLLDDIPISVYADKGFGVYLKNTRR